MQITKSDLIDAIDKSEEGIRVEIKVGDEAVKETLMVRLEGLDKVLDARFSSLRAWGIAAFVGGQAVAGLLAALVTRTAPRDIPEAVVNLVGKVF